MTIKTSNLINLLLLLTFKVVNDLLSPQSNSLKFPFLLRSNWFSLLKEQSIFTKLRQLFIIKLVNLLLEQFNSSKLLKADKSKEPVNFSSSVVPHSLLRSNFLISFLSLSG